MTKLVKFVGPRLRSARVARMMTGRALAEAVGVTPAAITRFEQEKASPRDEVVGRLGVVLRVPAAHFFLAALPDNGSPFRMRSMSAATKRAREAAMVRVDWLREIVGFVAEVMPLPETSVPDLVDCDDPTVLSGEDVEEAASDVRRAWGLGDGPIANLTELLESNGFVVSRFSLGADTLDAFGKWAAEAPIVVENTDRTSAVRTRFDLAHELAHMVMHRHVPPELAGRPEVHKLMESQAHRFAGAFLFPANSFANEIYSVTVAGLVEPKRRWMISIQAMVRRAFDLEMISQDQYVRAFRRLSAQGYRKKEPLDDELEPEFPSEIPDRIRQLVERQGFSAEELESQIRQDRREIETLSGLEPGYLDRAGKSGPRGKVVRLPTR